MWILIWKLTHLNDAHGVCLFFFFISRIKLVSSTKTTVHQVMVKALEYFYFRTELAHCEQTLNYNRKLNDRLKVSIYIFYFTYKIC